MSATATQHGVTDYVEQSIRERPRPKPVSPTSSIPTEWDLKQKDAVDELLQLRNLGDNWDGDGALAPIPELVDGAIEFINQRRYPMPPSRIVPVNDGRITLEWEIHGYYFSLRIESPSNGRQMVVMPNGDTEFYKVSWD
jgi:hypothetical protein